MLMLKEGKIDTEWSNMLGGCQGEGEGIYQAAEADLKATDAPGITWKRDTVAPSWTKGILGKRRDYLVVKSSNFRRYVFLANARDFGSNLDVSWYLVYEPLIPKALAALAFVLSPLLLAVVSLQTYLVLLFLGASFLVGTWLYQRSLDIFDQQDLRAYVTVAHHAVLEAVKGVCEKKNVEVDRIQRKSRGKHAVLA